jgi:hypothetical protein
MRPARVVWVIVALPALGFFLVSTPGYLSGLYSADPVDAPPALVSAPHLVGIVVSPRPPGMK